MKGQKLLILKLLLIGLIITNGFLIFENRRLNLIISELSPKEIEPGDSISSFEANRLNGDFVKFNFGENERNTVLLYFQPSCGFCKKQMRNWKTLIENLEQSQYRYKFITAANDVKAIREYLAQYGIVEEDVLIVGSEFVKGANLNGTPVTVVLDRDGVVEYRWIGLWQENDISEVSKIFAATFSTNRSANE